MLPSGAVVYTVKATDNDISAANNMISYSLISGDHGMFSIQSESGEITVSQMLDRESDREEYHLVISAVDSGQPVLSSQQTLTIKVRLSCG